jgi:hypothetical protein
MRREMGDGDDLRWFLAGGIMGMILVEEVRVEGVGVVEDCVARADIVVEIDRERERERERASRWLMGLWLEWKMADC